MCIQYVSFECPSMLKRFFFTPRAIALYFYFCSSIYSRMTQRKYTCNCSMQFAAINHSVCIISFLAAVVVVVSITEFGGKCTTERYGITLLLYDSWIVFSTDCETEP